MLTLSAALLAFIVSTAQSAPPAVSAPPPEELAPPADTEPPVIHGAQDLIAEAGTTVSYRSGIHVTDNADTSVPLEIDASAVDLSAAGSYPVVYRAVDTSGNETLVTVTLTVTPAPEASNAEEEPLPTPAQDAQLVVTQEMLDAVCARVLSQITTPEAGKLEQARAIYNYVYHHIKYVGSSDKSDWVRGAYIGLTRGKGDCFNYYAASRALLTACGIDNLSLERVGGTSRHYWNLVNLGDGWYHFDSCWAPTGYPHDGFLMTEAQVREYTELLQTNGVRVNYYVYDYAACPVTVVGTPEELPEPPVEEPPAEEPPTELLPTEGETAAPPDGDAAVPDGDGEGLPELPEENTPADGDITAPPADSTDVTDGAERAPDESILPTDTETEATDDAA